MAETKWTTPDYSEFDSPALESNILARLNRLALEHQKQALAVARLSNDLKIAEAVLENIEEHQIPALMEEAEQDEVTTSAGLRIKMKEQIEAHISEANAEKAHTWLEDNGHGRLIKRTFEILFGKEEEGWARRFEADLARRKRPLNCKRRKGVNANTLKAFVREQLGDGVEVPQDLFGIFRRRVAKVEVPGE
jgi:type I site-specific restriction-modification system R (restriction) subunit